jgi:hypothetical protein
MKTWIIVAIIVGLLIIGFVTTNLIAQDTEANKNTINCSSCGNGCNSTNNCGLSSCGAISGKTCGCNK